MHYWPLDNPQNIRDLRTTTWGSVEEPAVISINGVEGGAVELDGNTPWIDLTTMKNSCLHEPTNCDTGATIALWLQFYSLQPDKTFLSVGNEFENDQGFRLYQVPFLRFALLDPNSFDILPYNLN